MGYLSTKTFQGRPYRGMRVGQSHQWRYEGSWSETKLAPRSWEVRFEASKLRLPPAPSGSGAPLGSRFQWLIAGRQYVLKVDADTYKTLLIGSKSLLGFAKPDGAWTPNEATRSRWLRRDLKGLIQDPILAGGNE